MKEWRIRKWIPLFAFLGGLLWDSLTIGRAVQKSDLWILGAYWLAAAIALFFLGRNPSARWQSRITWVVQFCFGSLFMSLVICYFRSSGSIFTWISILVLSAVLVANEFLQDRYERQTLSWSLFTLGGSMYCNFLLPHVVYRLGFHWFILSLGLAFFPVIVLWLVSSRRILTLLAPLGVSLTLLVFGALNLIPPVPLVIKQNLVCKDFQHQLGVYSCMVGDGSFAVRWGFVPRSIYQLPQDKVYVLTAIFGPDRVLVNLEHHWQWFDPKTSNWQDQGRVPFRLSGGRKEGWRVYSTHQRLGAGLWRVVTQVQDGPVLGYADFIVKDGPEPAKMQYHPARLN